MAPQRWLLLRGLAREQGHWNGFPAHFEAALGAPAHCLDLAGAGTEHLRRAPLSLEALVRDLRARFVAQHGHPQGGLGLLGVSLGGMVCLAWAQLFPDDLAAVVVVNTSAGGVSPPWKRMQPTALVEVLRAAATKDPVARELRVLRLTTSALADPLSVATEWAAVQAARPMRRVNVARQLLAAARFRVARSLRVPLLVVSSRGDRLAHPGCSRALALRFGAPLVEHADAGHDLSADAPEWLSAQVAAWAGPRAPAQAQAGMPSKRMELR